MSLFLVYARLKTNRTKTNTITNSFQGMVSISKNIKAFCHTIPNIGAVFYPVQAALGIASPPVN
jgi:hypothetical protein